MPTDFGHASPRDGGAASHSTSLCGVHRRCCLRPTVVPFSLQLAAELGLELVHTDWDSVLMCDAQGGALSLDAIDRAEAALTRLLEGVAERDMEHGDPLSLGDALATALSEEGEDQALIRHMLSITSEYECGATVHQLSATCYDCGECLGGQDMLVRGGVVMLWALAGKGRACT